MGIDLALPAWTEAVGQTAQLECVALHRHDGVPVADDAQGISPSEQMFMALIATMME